MERLSKSVTVRVCFTWTISNGVYPTSSSDNCRISCSSVGPDHEWSSECASSPIQTWSTATAEPGTPIYDRWCGRWREWSFRPFIGFIRNYYILCRICKWRNILYKSIACGSYLTINPVPNIPVSGGDKKECASSPIKLDRYSHSLNRESHSLAMQPLEEM
jgi:hypothetical protein